MADDAAQVRRDAAGRRLTRGMPVRIRGVEFASVALAAQAVGVSVAAIYRALDRGDIDLVGLGVTQRGLYRARPVRIGPLTFASRRAAARHFGVSCSAIRSAINGKRPRMMERLLGAAMRAADASARRAA